MDIINKTAEYKEIIENKEVLVKLAILSIPEDMEIDNLDMEEYREFVFLISVSVEPDLIKVIAMPRSLVYVLENGGEHRIGSIVNNKFIPIEKTNFLQGLMVRVFEVLAINSNTGNYKSW